MSRDPRPCPICGKPRAAAHSPFCSVRCRDRDLLQWLGEGYALPGPAIDLHTTDPDAIEEHDDDS